MRRQRVLNGVCLVCVVRKWVVFKCSSKAKSAYRKLKDEEEEELTVEIVKKSRRCVDESAWL